MKKATTLTLALLTSVALAGTAGAATPASGSHHHQPNADRIVQHMNKDLDLTAEQQSKLKAVFKEQGKKMRALRQETEAEINQVLTPEQQAKAKQLREERIKKFKEKRGEWKKKHPKQ